MTTRSITLPDVLVRAALAGRVSEIRVPVRPQPDEDWLARWVDPPEPFWRDTSDRKYRCPFGVAGDRLVVREVWSPDHRDVYPCIDVVYRADGHVPTHGAREHVAGCSYDRDGVRHFECLACANRGRGFRWRSPTTMPARVSRLTFTNLGTRVERAPDMTDADALACGVVAPVDAPQCPCEGDEEEPGPYHIATCAWRDEQIDPTGHQHLDEYAILWNLRYGKRFQWSSSPWQWCANVVIA